MPPDLKTFVHFFFCSPSMFEIQEDHVRKIVIVEVNALIANVYKLVKRIGTAHLKINVWTKPVSQNVEAKMNAQREKAIFVEKAIAQILVKERRIVNLSQGIMQFVKMIYATTLKLDVIKTIIVLKVKNELLGWKKLVSSRG